MFQIVAYDQDLGENGTLKFLILSGNEDGGLDIDLTGGQIKVASASKLRNKGTYRLHVAVEDYGLPPKRTETLIFVEVRHFIFENYHSSVGHCSTVV